MFLFTAPAFLFSKHQCHNAKEHIEHDIEQHREEQYRVEDKDIRRDQNGAFCHQCANTWNKIEKKQEQCKYDDATQDAKKFPMRDGHARGDGEEEIQAQKAERRSPVPNEHHRAKHPDRRHQKRRKVGEYTRQLTINDNP